MLVLTMTITIIALLLASAVFLAYARHSAKSGLVEDISSLAQLLASRSTAALTFDDKRLAEENLAAVRSKSAVIAACIIDKTGKPFASLDVYPAQGFPCLIPQQGERHYVFSTQYLDIFEPMLLQGEVVGTIYLRASLEELNGLWMKYLLVAVAIVIFCALLALLLSARLLGIITEPLTRLTGAAEKIAQRTREESLVTEAERVKKTTADELGTLVDAFNNMLDQIGERDRFLQEANEHLEERVQRRTEELIRARELAEAANLAKSNFLARMSHELRTPLNAILGFSQLMVKDATTSAEHRHQLGIINRSGEHLLTMINDVLDLSKIEAGKMTLSVAVFDLRHLCQEAVELMRFRAEEKKLFLKLLIEDEVPQRIRSDGMKLRQIILNMLGNAVKFTESGGVVLLVSMPQPGILRLAVSDTGIGIDPDSQKSIFEPFVQAQNLANAKGTGLGLAISRKMCEMLGGRIGVDSEPGGGSCFWLEIPLEMAADGEPLTSLAETRQVAGLAAGQPVWRILAAEDDESSQALIRKLLEQTGIEVRVAGNGEEAVHIFRQWKPDLVLMDIRMPVMDGIEATRIIRGLPEGAQAPILALTASALREEQPEILAAGCNDVLFKPVNVQQLLMAIAAFLPVEYRYEAPSSETGASAGYFERHSQPEVEEAQLPEELWQVLMTSAQRLDGETIEARLPEVARLAPALAQNIGRCVQGFDFGQIVIYLESRRHSCHNHDIDAAAGERHG
ncbi:MAG: response regulator [Proteobacteria bacterium]|nr:response regulator [Pseudomonadota bacterium]